MGGVVGVEGVGVGVEGVNDMILLQVLYGEEEEEMMASSPDPVIRRIWNDKDVCIIILIVVCIIYISIL